MVPSRVVDGLRSDNNDIGQVWPTTQNCRGAGIHNKCCTSYTQSGLEDITTEAFYMPWLGAWPRWAELLLLH